MLTDAEIAYGAARQDTEWNGAPPTVDAGTVGHWQGSNAEPAPRDLAETGDGLLGAASPSTRPRGHLLPMSDSLTRPSSPEWLPRRTSTEGGVSRPQASA